MQATVFTLLFLATAPVLLMPTFIAFASRRGHAAKVVAANILLWVILNFSLRPLVVGGHGPGSLLPFQPSLIVLLLAWLGLLRYAIVGGVPLTTPTTPAPSQDAAARGERTGPVDH